MKKLLDKIVNLTTEFVNSEPVKILGISFIPCFIVILLLINFFAEESKHFYPHQVVIQHRENVLHLQSVKFDLVTETENYIKKIAPGSCLNALTLVESCDEYDIDLIFVLAQGQIESHYGTRGIAAKTNSVFNVHSFDGVSADQILKSGKGYKHPDYSVRPYLELLQNNYLVNGKTERDLFKNFVDLNGHRYASAETYEDQLMNTYLKIQTETSLDSLLTEYRKYKLITYQ